MYERFTDAARKIFNLANREANKLHHDYIGTKHILLGLIMSDENITAVRVLKNLGLDLSKIQAEVEKEIEQGLEVTTTNKLPQTPRAKKVVEYAMEESRGLNHNYVGTEHILLGLIHESEGLAAEVLTRLGLTLEMTQNEVKRLLSDATTTEVKTETEPEPEQPPVVHQKYQGVSKSDFWEFIEELNQVDKDGWTEIIKIGTAENSYYAIMKRPN